MRTKLAVAIVVSGLFMSIAVVPLAAHHAFAAEFDANKPVKFEGTVTKMEWTNPHVWIHVDVKKPDGTIEKWAFEAGTPNVADAVGLAAACDYLDGIGMDAVRAHEVVLLESMIAKLSAVDGVRIYGPRDLAQRSGVVSFTVEGIHPHDLSTVLDQDGVCIRAGHHCAQPLMRRLNVPATARASVYVYNDPADIDALVKGVERAKLMFR